MTRDCQDLNPIREPDVHDREAPDEAAADIGGGDSRHATPRLGSSLDPRNDPCDRSEEVRAKAGALLVVESSGRRPLGLRLDADSDRPFQPFSRSRRRRARTSGQALPGSSPDRARTADSSIAHAASASSSTSASRATISWANGGTRW